MCAPHYRLLPIMVQGSMVAETSGHLPPMPLLLLLSAAAFLSAFSSRILDPLVPSMARDLDVLVTTVALLSSAYTFPYALSQPVIGAIGDQLGKERILKICTAMLTLALVAATVAPNYATLFLARVSAGIAGGGMIPVAFAIVGDKVPVAQRQSALARIVMGSQLAVLLGSAMSGLIAVQFGWRAIFAVATGISVLTFALMLFALPTPPTPATTPLSWAKVRSQYGAVLANPLTPTVLAAAAVEGMAMLGLLPYVADRLETRGMGGPWEAGLVIATMSIGGITYTLLVRPLLRFLGREGLLRVGGVIAALAMGGIAYSPSWQIEALSFGALGFGFFSVHNSLQLQATELAPSARSSSVALFAFCFFLGQAAGPLLYHAGFALLGVHIPIVIGALSLLALGFGLAWRLQPTAVTPNQSDSKPG